MQTAVNIGDLAPDFTLPSIFGTDWRLHEQRGKVVALLFYPGDETLVCTKQLCSVRENWQRYLATGAEIVGISPGTVEDHKSFAEKYNLPLNLLADHERQVTSRFVKHLIWPIWTTRGVVVIDAEGFIRYRTIMLRAFRPSDDEVLAEIHLARYDRLTKK
jgi:peroxiredoxin Q/BCP